jgi:hypothetical protein
MRVKVRPMRRAGRNLHQKEQMALPPFVGELTVAEARDPELGRPVLRARLQDLAGSSSCDILPELSDVQLLWAMDQKMRLSGFECIDKAAYAQTWSVEVV